MKKWPAAQAIFHSDRQEVASPGSDARGTSIAPVARATAGRGKNSSNEKSKQKGRRIAPAFMMTWCPGEDSNLHGVTR
jgi:hypothetical protein